MTRAASILSILLILISATGVTIDQHFCGGRVVDVRLAVDDKKASCGMEEDDMVCPNITAFNENCCHNELSKFSVSDYSISSILMIDKPLYSVSNILCQAPEVSIFISFRNLITLNDTGPPGSELLLPDQQSILCIFRI
jgi:hypothetical protein